MAFVWWWWWWWWIVFVVWLIDERRLALFPVGTVVRDLHHLESPTCSKQDLNLRRTSVQTCWMKLCSSDNHYTTAPFAPFISCNSLSKRIIDCFFRKWKFEKFFCIVAGGISFCLLFKLNTFTRKISDLLLLRELRDPGAVNLVHLMI